MSYGLTVFDHTGTETLNIDSFSMRTVFNITKDSINPEGEVIALPGFEPARGVVMVVSYGQGAQYSGLAPIKPDTNSLLN